MTIKRHQVALHLLSSVASVVMLMLANGCAQSTSAGDPLASSAGSSNQVSDVRALCEAWVDSDVAGRDLLKVDFVSGDPAKIAASVKAYWAEEEPILIAVEQQAPAELKATVHALVQLAHTGQANGDSGTLQAPELETSDQNIDKYMVRECGYPEVPVVATDTEYQGVPNALGAETVAITLTNRGRDEHQIILSRINDGVTQSIAEILQQTPAQQAALATSIALAESGPGQSSSVFVPLTTGRYGMFDAYPQGTTAETMGNGPPHFMLGLVSEFTVA